MSNHNNDNDDELVIPIIRLDDPDRSKTVEKLREACINVGFFYLQGHGIEGELLQNVMQQSKLLFELPLTQKQALSDPLLSRGYTALYEETLDPNHQTMGDTKEGFYIGQQVPQDSASYNPAKLRGPNQWPSKQTTPDLQDPDAFRTIMETYYTEMCQLGLHVVRLLASAIGVSQNYFDDAFLQEHSMASLRLLHYTSKRSNLEKGIMACGAHSDYGMVTLLLTDDNPGLQILTKQGTWMDAPPLPETFVVNIGDMLERWTNGLFRSTQHRVLNFNGKERYSIPFFYEPNFDTRVECLDVCCSKDNNPAKYPPTTSGQHLLDKYKQTHADFTPSE